MLLDHCYAFTFNLLLYPSDLKKKPFEEDALHDLFLSSDRSTPRQIWPKNPADRATWQIWADLAEKNLKHRCGTIWVLYDPTKFRKYHG